ncbi:MAG: thioredoxin domain-containing protein [Pseudomonadota bacterium]
MKKSTILFAFIAAILGVVVVNDWRGSFAEPIDAFQGEPAIIAATFTSEWCSACKVLEPRLKEARSRLGDTPVRFVEFDFTFGERPEHTEIAAKHGLSDLYGRYKGATGFTVLVDAKTGARIDTLTINYSANAIRAAIVQAAAAARLKWDTSSAG